MNNLRKARLAVDKSQQKLMQETGIFYSTISRLERGWLMPTPRQKMKLAKALEVDADWLFPNEVEEEIK